MMNKIHFEIFFSKEQEFYFRLRDKNSTTLLVSEGYTTKANAIKGIHSIKKNAPRIEKLIPRESENGKYFYVIKAGNGQVIGKSSLYTTDKLRNSAMKKVREQSPEADILDFTKKKK